MMSRAHQRHGWLFLSPGDWRVCLDRQIQARDALDDINQSGPAPAWVQWCDEVQMPRLASQQGYQKQFQDRIAELQLRLGNLEQQIAAGRLDLEPHAGITRREIKWLMGLMEVAA
jgi:hypothetical protein